MSENVADKQHLAVEMDGGNQPVLVAANTALHLL
jgi:hypothetical protein